MPSALCQVCFNPKHKPRFQTRSLCICQWCITELKYSLDSPAEIIFAARARLRDKRMTELTNELDRLHPSARRVAEVQSNLARVDQIVDDDFKRFMSRRIAEQTTKFKGTRLLRAHELGILQTERVFARRPEGSEADEMGRYIRARDGYLCVICRRVPTGSELHVHHIIPLSNFGTNYERNLATLCYSCHGRQHPDFKVERMKRKAVAALPVKGNL
jgi:hypothetical protein